MLGVLASLESPTRQSFVSEIVGREHIQSAVSLNSSIFNAARIVGPGLAGIMIAAVGTGACFVLNAVSFVAVLVGLALIHAGPARPIAARAARARSTRRSSTAFRYVGRYAQLAVSADPARLFGTFGYNFQVILPLLARYTLQSGAVGFGILDAAMGIGSLVGALGVAARLTPNRRSVLLAATGFSILLDAGWPSAAC